MLAILFRSMAFQVKAMKIPSDSMAPHFPIIIQLGLYKGLSALLTFSVPKTAVRFGSNEALKTHVFKVNTL